MSDPRFYDKLGPFQLRELLEEGLLHGLAESAFSVEITGVNSLGLANMGELAFVGSNKRFKDIAARTKSTVVLVTAESREWVPSSAIAVECENPLPIFNHIAKAFYPELDAGFFATSSIDPSAKIHESAQIGANVTIGAGVEIGAGSRIGASSFIGRGVSIGRDCSIYPNTTITYALLGDRVTIQSGARIGLDGFGFIAGETHERLWHIGRVIIQSDVEVGANASIDRGVLADTVIGEGTKLDNLVHIAHNVQIGRHVFIAGCSGIAGSAVIGDYAVLAGAVGVGDHAEIGAHANVAGLSSVPRSVPGGEVYSGRPARPIKDHFREKAVLRRLTKKSKAGNDPNSTGAQ